MWEKPVWAWAGIIVLAVAVAGCMGLDRGTEPPELLDEIAQSSSAFDRGVTIEALGASFSGTETLVRLKLTVENEADLLGALGRDGPVERVGISGSGYSGPFGGEPLTSTTNRKGDTVVQLPALEVPAGYDAAVEFDVTALHVFVDSRPVVLEGDWPLTLAGPPPAEIGEMLRVEEFAPEVIQLEGGPAEVSGVRSRSATTVFITLPEGVLMVSPPTLRSDGERLMPVTFDPEAPDVSVTFAATPFGEAVELELGTLATPRGSCGQAVTLAFSDVLDGAGGAEEFDIPAPVIIEGDPDLVLGGVQGRYNRGRWVGVLLAGAWHPENSKPVFIDGQGDELELAHVQIGYSRGADGTTGDGTTEVAAFVRGDTDLDRLTIVLGGESTVDNADYTARLIPR